MFGAPELQLDTSKLAPHRLLYDPSGAVGGFENGLFADRIYLKPQVSITMDRTVYYDEEGMAQSAIRVRWVANTHPHTDEIVVDAETLSIVNETTRSGKNWESKNEVVFVRGGNARVTNYSDQAAPEHRVFPLTHRHHYGLMILPYLFASMNVPDGTHFRLPAIGSDREGYVEIEVVGARAFTNAANEDQTALLVRSKHGWGGEIDWYVDQDAAPYHVHAVWWLNGRETNEGTSISNVIDWVEFKRDVHDGVVDNRALQRMLDD